MDIELEYRVRPVTRYIVTAYRSDPSGSGSVSQCGEYDNETIAYEVAYAMCKQAHEMLGWPIGDERVKYPERPLPPVEIKS